MRYLLASVLKDLRRLWADPLALALWMGIPLMIGSLMALASGIGDGGGPKVRVLLVDEDDTLLTRLVKGSAGSLGGEDGGSLFELEPVSAEEGRRRIDAGEGSALVTLPEGFTRALLEERPTRLEVLTNPAQRVLPELLVEALELLREAVFYAHRIVGEPVRGFVEDVASDAGFPEDAAVAELSAAINARVRELERVLFPPVLELERAAAEGDEDRQGFNFGLVLLPGVVFMALLFVAQGMSDDLWKEKAQGTLVRALATPHGVAAFLGGKLLAAGLVTAVVAAAGIGVGVARYGLPARALLFGVPWCVLVGMTLLALFFVVQVFASSQRGGSVLGTVVIFPLMMLGGSFFPFEAMPDWMIAVGRWTPNGRALLELKAELEGGLDAGSLAVSTGYLALLALGSLWLCGARLRRFAR